MIIETLEPYVARTFLVKFATLRWEEEGARRLRQAVFCDEQQIFTAHDRDAIDAAIAEWTRDKESDAIEAMLQSVGIPAHIVKQVAGHGSGPLPSPTQRALKFPTHSPGCFPEPLS